MSVPFIIWLVIFGYVPIWGWTMAFQKYKPGLSFFAQKWVGMANFIELWHDKRFWGDFRNTLGMSVLGIIFGTICPIVLALLINEIRFRKFKRTVQTISYLPHFISWVIVANIFYSMLSPQSGIVNIILLKLGIISQPVQFMAMPSMFWGILTFASVWKEVGWGTIIYLAAIAGVDQELYEAATVDGCGRFKKMRYITIPGIMPTIVVLFILGFGALTQIGFERQMLLGNPMVQDVSEVIDLYALKFGIGSARYSLGTAVAVFNSLISLTLLVSANTVFKKLRGESVF